MEADDQRVCERCGDTAPGRERWMFHRPLLIFGPRDLPVQREFYCHRCLRIHRWQTGIAIGVFVIVLIAVVTAAILLRPPAG